MHWLEARWYRLSPLHLVLWPLSLVFGVLTALRRFLFRRGILGSTRLPVPVVIVGNINVGGTGKTPCVIWLAQWLAEHGRAPGIIARGYGGENREPQRVTAESDPAQVGDEAVLLARRCSCPVWVGSSRAAAGLALIAENPQCDVVISDDGLQHYALQRDVELVVFDGERGCGNGMLLPAGPLREPVSRLHSVDALVINGGTVFPHEMLPSHVPAFDMQLEGTRFYALNPPHGEADAAHFARSKVRAIAAIGNPQKFFNHLHEMGVAFTAQPFPDHHAYTASDCAFGAETAVIMTEKDAVKCERLAGDRDSWWALRVDAAIDSALGELVLGKIGKRG
jgi:tetraacyldisaccharide 4'-kinase